jgi:hypothetical protein
MASYEAGTETVTRTIYRLKTPTNAVEVSRMIQAAAREMAGTGSPNDLPDDALTVDVRDEEIVAWWEVTT